MFVSGAAGASARSFARSPRSRAARVVALSRLATQKLAWLKSVGVDAGVNYKTAAICSRAVHAGAPKGIDIYFDNVGGEHLEVAIEVASRMRALHRMRHDLDYNDDEPPPGPRNMAYIVGKRLKLQGFIVSRLLSTCARNSSPT